MPSVRSLKFYIDANLESAGDSIQRLKESRKQYLEMIKEKENEVDKSSGTLCNALKLLIIKKVITMKFSFVL